MTLVFFTGCAAAPVADGPKTAPRTLPELRGDPSARAEAKAVLSPLPAGGTPVAIVGATLHLGDGRVMENGAIVLQDGRITQVGAALAVTVPEGARTVAGEGRHVTPGLIDTHSHMGVYAVPGVQAHADGNEMTDPTTPYVFAEHGFWPQDPAIDDAVAGGVTTIQVLPGSGNLIGGRAVTMKLRPRREARAMRFPDAPFGLKMACGENPKRVYGGKGQQPMSRMGNVFRVRQAFLRAREYVDKRARYEAAHEAWSSKLEAAKADEQAESPGDEPAAPPRDLGLETLAAVLDGQIRLHVHCYRADEMLLMLALGDELGFEVASFHHATEAYKIADVLAARRVTASVWADWWGFKMEAWDAVEANAAMIEAAGGQPIIHSDSPIGIQRLNQEASKAVHAGRALGLDVPVDRAVAWMTKNPAEALGIGDQVGTLEVGKMADVVVWDRHPLSIYARATIVLIDGEVVLDRGLPRTTASDFDVGTPVEVLP